MNSSNETTLLPVLSSLTGTGCSGLVIYGLPEPAKSLHTHVLSIIDRFLPTSLHRPQNPTPDTVVLVSNVICILILYESAGLQQATPAISTFQLQLQALCKMLIWNSSFCRSSCWEAGIKAYRC